MGWFAFTLALVCFAAIWINTYWREWPRGLTQKIVSLLIVLRTGRKATKRTYEMIQFYLIGWVTDEEFEAHLSKLERKEASAKKPA